MDDITLETSENVFGERLTPCAIDPVTGFFRNGFCDTCAEDFGSHTVCTQVTDEFLAFSKAHGNDLSTPNPDYEFPGLKAGDQWCVCAARWKEAADAGVIAPVLLKATHKRALELIPLEFLKQHALDSKPVNS